MAFEGLNKYADALAKEYNKSNDYKYLYALTMFHDIALVSPKFKGQRQHVLTTIYELNPSYFTGYFKREKP